MFPKPFPDSETPSFNHAVFHFQGLTLNEVPDFFFSRIKQIAILEGKPLDEAAKAISHITKDAKRPEILRILEHATEYVDTQAETAV